MNVNMKTKKKIPIFITFVDVYVCMCIGTMALIWKKNMSMYFETKVDYYVTIFTFLTFFKIITGIHLSWFSSGPISNNVEHMPFMYNVVFLYEFMLYSREIILSSIIKIKNNVHSENLNNTWEYIQCLDYELLWFMLGV